MDINTENLKGFIAKIARNVVNDSSLQDIVTGVIKESLPGKYMVQLTEAPPSALIEAVPFYEKQTYRVDDYVYLIGGKEGRGSEYITKYFIFGTVIDTQQNYANMSEFEKFQGNKIFFQYAELNENNTSFTCDVDNGSDFINSIRAFGAFSLSAQVTSKYNKYVKYGLKITINREVGASTEIEFLGDNYVGQPFVLTDSTQKKNIEIENYEKVISVKVELILPTDVDNSKTKFTNISLESGTWLNLEEDFSVELEIVNNINYFKKNDNNGQVEIKAIAKYKGQILDTPLLKYYWFIDNKTSQDEVLFGMHNWKCINDSSVLKVLNESGNIIDDTYGRKIYKANNNIIKFSLSDRDRFLKKYKNNLKCVVTYLLENFKSPQITIFNFNKEAYGLSLSTKGSNPILSHSDSITIFANLSKPISVPQNFEYTYRWFSEESDIPLFYINEKEEKVEYSDNFIIVKYTNENEKSSQNYYNIGDKTKIKIYCKAFLTLNGVIDDEIASTLDFSDISNNKAFIEVISNLSEIDNYVEETFFSYNINSFVSPKFGKTEGKGDNNQKYIKYYDFIDVPNRINNVALEWLKTDEVLKELNDGKYYLFYSKQIRTRDIRTNSFVRYENYEIPKVLRYVEIKAKEIRDILTDAGIDQLNIFNGLTDNGSNDILEFKEDENGKEKLYINATYIRSGTLEVKNNEGTLFRASLEDKDRAVTIAGFKVDAFNIFNESGNIGLYSGDKNNLPYFWVGGTKNNPVTKLLGDGSGNIGAFNISKTGEIRSLEDGFYLHPDGNGKLGKLQYNKNGEVYVGDKGDEKFLIDANGNTFIKGKIAATSGSIGGFHITNDHIGAGEEHKENETVYLSGTGLPFSDPDNKDTVVFYSGEAVFQKDDNNQNNFVSAPLYFTKNGFLYSTKGKIGGFTIGKDCLKTNGLKFNETGTIIIYNGETPIFKIEADKITSLSTGASINFDYFPTSNETIYTYRAILDTTQYLFPKIRIEKYGDNPNNVLIADKTFKIRGLYYTIPGVDETAVSYVYTITIKKDNMSGDCGKWGGSIIEPKFEIYNEETEEWVKAFVFSQQEKGSDKDKAGININGKLYVNGTLLQQ